MAQLRYTTTPPGAFLLQRNKFRIPVLPYAIQFTFICNLRPVFIRTNNKYWIYRSSNVKPAFLPAYGHMTSIWAVNPYPKTYLRRQIRRYGIDHYFTLLLKPFSCSSISAILPPVPPTNTLLGAGSLKVPWGFTFHDFKIIHFKFVAF